MTASDDYYSQTATAIIRIDKTKPIVSGASASLASDKQSSTITVTANDPFKDVAGSTEGRKVASGIESYSFDGGSKWQPDKTKKVTSNGTYTVKVKDKAGNVSDAKSVTVSGIETDKTAPKAATMTMKLENSSGSNYSNNTWTNKSVYIKLNNDASDSGSGVASSSYAVTKNGSSYLSNQTGANTLSDAGTYAITVTTKDKAGNTGTNSYTVKIDKTAPTAGTVTASAKTTKQSSVTIYMSQPSDSDSGIDIVYISGWYGEDWVSKSKRTQASYDSTNKRYYVTLNFADMPNTTTGNTNQGDGNYKFKAHVYDAAGNETMSNRINVIYDTTAPTAATMAMKLENSSGSNYSNGTWTNQSVYISLNNDASDSGSGVESSSYSVTKNGSAYLSNQTGAKTLTDTGTYEITVTTKDKAGNTATNSNSYTVKIDKTAPTVGTVTASATTTNQSSVTIYMSQPSDSDSGIGKVYVSGWYGTSFESKDSWNEANYDSTNKRYYVTLNFADLPNTSTGAKNQGDGNYQFDAEVLDVAGNKTRSSIINVIYDTTAPTAATMTMKLENSSGSNYSNNTWTNKSVYIKLNNDASDSGSKVKSSSYVVTKNGSSYLSNQTGANTLTDTGTYTITVTTEDNAGYTATNSYTVKIDKTNPTAGTLTMKLGNNNGSAYSNNTWTNQSVYVYANAASNPDSESGHKSTTYSINRRNCKRNWNI